LGVLVQSASGGGVFWHDGSVGLAIQSTGATVFGGGQEGSLGVSLQFTSGAEGLTGRSVCIGGDGVGGFSSVKGG
jgi:hypothetical protein